jgi:hypothetical protein
MTLSNYTEADAIFVTNIPNNHIAEFDHYVILTHEAIRLRIHMPFHC